MKKFVFFFVIMAIVVSSCAKNKEYLPLPGEYTAVCKIYGVEYNISVILNDDLSGKLVFSPESAMSDWEFYYASADKSIKYFTSLGEESEVKNENVKYLFKFVLGDFDNIADVSHSKISGVDVSVLKMTDGAVIYTDSQSGAPLRLEYKDMTVDITSRPTGE